MPKRTVTGGGSADLDEMFADGQAAEAAQRGAPAPKKYGNVTEAQDPIHPPASQQASSETPEPVAPPAPEPESEPVADETPEPEVPETTTAAPDYASEIDNLKREILFLRSASAQPSAAPAAAAPPQESPRLPFGITPQDVEVIRNADPAQAAALLQGGMQLIYERAREDAKAELRGEYYQARATENHGQALERQFAQQFPELLPYSEVVLAAAGHVGRQYPGTPEHMRHLLLPEVARLARARLTEMGVKLSAAPTAQAPRRSKAKPAVLEGGGAARSGGGGGSQRMSQTEREVLAMFNDAMGVTH